jgi:hypothetical protein
MPCTRARSSHTRQRTSSYDEPSAARRPRRGRAHSSAPRGRRAPSLQSTLFIAAPQGHSGRNHSVWGTRAATRHRKRHPPSCVVDPPRASFRLAPLPTDLRPRILYRPPPPAGSYNLRSGSCTYLTPTALDGDEAAVLLDDIDLQRALRGRRDGRQADCQCVPASRGLARSFLRLVARAQAADSRRKALSSVRRTHSTT